MLLIGRSKKIKNIIEMSPFTKQTDSQTRKQIYGYQRGGINQEFGTDIRTFIFKIGNQQRPTVYSTGKSKREKSLKNRYVYMQN